MMKKKIILFISIIVYFAFAWINAYAAVMFIMICNFEYQCKPVSEKRNVKKRMLYAVDIVGYSIPAFIAIFLFYYGDWKHSIYVNEIEVLSSVEMLILMVIPGLFFLKTSKELLSKKLLQKKDFILISGVFVPFLLNDIGLFMQRYNRFFSTTDVLNEILNELIFAALFEELFFRFFLYQKIKRLTRTVFTAQIISSLIFALWHISLVQNLLHEFRIEVFLNLVVIFFVGLICTMLYERTGRLFVAVLFHAVNNGLIYNIMNIMKNLIVSR